MNIEQGDYFVVTRGFKLGDMSGASICALALGFGDGGPREQAPKEPSYDRSHEGIVYRAEAVCGPVIAAVAVAFDAHASYERGRSDRMSLNTNEVEAWPVTEAYVNVIRDAETVK